MQKKKVGHIRIDGSTPQSARQALVTRFQENDNVRAAVVCLKFICVLLRWFQSTKYFDCIEML